MNYIDNRGQHDRHECGPGRKLWNYWFSRCHLAFYFSCGTGSSRDRIPSRKNRKRPSWASRPCSPLKRRFCLQQKIYKPRTQWAKTNRFSAQWFSYTTILTTHPLSKQDFKPSKETMHSAASPRKKKKDSLPPLACTQQAYGEKEHFAWTGNFLKMPHTSKKSYFN